MEIPTAAETRDFFLLDLADVVLKDDMATMEHPFYSLATRPDLRTLHYGEPGRSLTITPSTAGLPTIHDKDILIFCISHIVERMKRGEPYSRLVKFSAYDLLKTIRRPLNNLTYDRLEDAFARLRGTTFTSDIRTGNEGEKRIFGMVDEAAYTYRQKNGREVRGLCRVALSHWLMEAIEAREVLTIPPEYFDLRRPLERRLYEIARKHCGQQERWQIALDKLQAKTGSSAPAKKFRLNLRQIIKDDHMPEYRYALDARDMVTVTPRPAPVRRLPGFMVSPKALEQAAAMLLGTGLDKYEVQADWERFAQEKGGVKSPDAAFIGFVKKVVAGVGKDRRKDNGMAAYQRQLDALFK